MASSNKALWAGMALLVALLAVVRRATHYGHALDLLAMNTIAFNIQLEFSAKQLLAFCWFAGPSYSGSPQVPPD